MADVNAVRYGRSAGNVTQLHRNRCSDAILHFGTYIHFCPWSLHYCPIWVEFDIKKRVHTFSRDVGTTSKFWVPAGCHEATPQILGGAETRRWDLCPSVIRRFPRGAADSVRVSWRGLLQLHLGVRSFVCAVWCAQFCVCRLVCAFVVRRLVCSIWCAPLVCSIWCTPFGLHPHWAAAGGAPCVPRLGK